MCCVGCVVDLDFMLVWWLGIVVYYDVGFAVGCWWFGVLCYFEGYYILLVAVWFG